MYPIRVKLQHIQGLQGFKLSVLAMAHQVKMKLSHLCNGYFNCGGRQRSTRIKVTPCFIYPCSTLPAF